MRYKKNGSIPKTCEESKKITAENAKFFLLTFIKGKVRNPEASGCINLALRTLCFLKNS
jgi:hypothetical protein